MQHFEEEVNCSGNQDRGVEGVKVCLVLQIFIILHR